MSGPAPCLWPILPATARSSARRCAGPIGSGRFAACRRRRRAASRSSRSWRCWSRSISCRTSPTICAHLIHRRGDRLALADRARYIADPALSLCPWRCCVGGLHRPARAHVARQEHGQGGSGDAGYRRGTSHMTIVDRWGNSAPSPPPSRPFGAASWCAASSSTTSSPTSRPAGDGRQAGRQPWPGKRRGP